MRSKGIDGTGYLEVLAVYYHCHHEQDIQARNHASSDRSF
jgi:hypothetical protein